MQWFRMYAEFATDPKVQSMDEAMQRRFVMLLCLNGAEELAKLDHDELAFALRIPVDELARTKELFAKKGLIDAQGRIANWDKRQFVSDSSGERVRKYRDKRRSLGLTSNGYTRHSDTVIKRDMGSCVYCDSAEKLCLDHVLPVTLGGNDEIENLVAACKACNSGKAGRTPDQAGYSWRNQTAKKRWEDWMSRRVTVSVTPSESDSESDTEKNKKKNSRAAAQPEPGEFVELRREYPKRAGSQRWHKALGAFRARVGEGIDPKTILAGVRRYAVFIRATGKERTELVQQAATFLGKDRGFELPWHPPAKPETAGARLMRTLNGGNDDSQVIDHEAEYLQLPGR